MRARSAVFVTGRTSGIQGQPAHARAGASLLAAILLAGCGGRSNEGPVAWWHALEGGRIASERPAAPGADAPFPSLASVPGRPSTTPSDVRAKIADGLVADRANAAYGASLSPVVPRAGAVPRNLPPPQDGASATMAAASPPRAAPRGAVSASPLPAPSVEGAPAEMPVMPSAPPRPPALPGVPQATSASLAAVAPKAVPLLAAEPKAGAPLPITFAAGSAAIAADDAKALKTLAGLRGTRTIAVIGFGDADTPDATAQQSALSLALARARAIATALAQSGVPEAAIRQEAQALGSGGVARIIE